jgi:hypothetical protein
MNVTVVLLLVSNFICVSSLVSECYKVNSLETFDRKAITKPICLSLISLSLLVHSSLFVFCTSSLGFFKISVFHEL